MTRVALVAIPLLVLLLISVPLILGSDRVVTQLTQRILPRVSQSLGREVTIESASMELVPRVEIAIRGLKIAGGPGEPPLLVAERSSASPKLWTLIRSFGRDLEIDGLLLENAQIALVKRRDGVWSYEELGAQQPGTGGSGQPVTDPAPAPELVEEEASDVAWVLRDLELRDAEVTMIDQSESPALQLRLPGLGMRAKEIAFGRPLAGTITGTLGGNRQNLKGEFRLDRLPESFDGLEPQLYPKLSGKLNMSGVPLEVVRNYLPSGFSELVTGGAMSGEAELSSAAGGEWVIAGPMRIEEMSLRGNPASAEAFTRLTLPAWNPDAFAVDFSGLQVKGPGVDLGGTARVIGEPMAVRFDLTGSLLDLDALIAALPPEAAQARAEAPTLAPASGTGGAGPGQEGPGPEGEAGLVSESARESLRGTAATGTLRIARVVRGKLEARDLEARATLQDGVLTLDQAMATFFGGRMDASGTKIDVTAPEPKWNLTAGLQGVDLGAAMAAVGGLSAIHGTAEGRLTLTGEGNDWNALLKTLVGQGRVLIEEGSLASMDLGATLSGPLAQLVPGGRLQTLADKAQGTTLKDLAASFQVKDGWLLLTRPLNVDTRFGTASLGGRIGLDQRLDLEGQMKLAPAFVSQVSGGRLKPSKAVPLPLEIGGTLKAPAVQTGAPKEAIRGAVEDKVRRRVEDELRDRARQMFPGLRK